MCLKFKCNISFHIKVFEQKSCDLSAGWPDATIQLQMMLQDAAQLWSRVTLDQPWTSQQAGKERLKVQEELLHYQSTSSSYCPVQGRQRVGRGSGKLPHRARGLLLLEALCGLPVWWILRKPEFKL